VLIGQRQQCRVAVRVCVDGELTDGGAGRGHHDRGGVGVLVGVDADDDVDELCEHGHCVLLLAGNGTCGSGPVGVRQDCDGTHQAATWWSSS
jgi:hypothetical protein